jgi:hypothetical protein
MQLICNVWILRFAQDDSAGLMPRSCGTSPQRKPWVRSGK